MIAASLHAQLDLLISGMTGLAHDGRFCEPNLDGSAGDYISFDTWEWPQGVGLYGLIRLWEHTARPELLVLLENWYDQNLQKGLPPLNVNTTAPLLALSILWSHTQAPRFQKVLDDWAHRLITHLPRTPEMGFEHQVSDRQNPGELWDDTLFMVALFLAHYGNAASRTDLQEEAIRQFLVHTRYLCDPETGLWFHGFTFHGRHHFARARWARGNAWVSAGLLDFIDMLPLSGVLRDFFLGVLKTQVATLLRLQAKSGAWHTLLDDPHSYEETSATAGFAYALLKGARLGIGDETWQAAGVRALQFVRSQIDERGTVQQVSYGTRMGHDLSFYKEIPIQPTAYGQALAMLALIEASQHTDIA